MKVRFEANPLNRRNFRKSAIATYCHSSSWLQLDQIVPCSLEELISSRNEALQIHHMRHDVPCEIHTASTKGAQPPLFDVVWNCWNCCYVVMFAPEG